MEGFEWAVYLYHIQPVKSLQLADPQYQRAFTQWLLQQDSADPYFLSQVLLTDEVSFMQNDVLNGHNMPTWSDENPYSIQETHFQYHFTVNTWARIIVIFLIGLYGLLPHLSGTYCFHFLVEY
jgi:hypothetical protein